MTIMNRTIRSYDLSRIVEDFQVNRADLESAMLPEATRSWTPIPHTLLIDTVEEALVNSGVDIRQSVHGMWQGGLRYYGLMEVVEEGPASDHGYRLIIGLRNSNDKTMRASFVVGAAFPESGLLTFTDEVFLGRKHTRFIKRDLPGMVVKALGTLSSARTSQDERFAAYKAKYIPDVQAHDLMIKVMDSGGIPGSNLPLVLREWRNPTTPCRDQDGDEDWSLWRLHNALGQALSKKNPLTWPDRCNKIHGVLDGPAGLLISPKRDFDSSQASTASL